MSPTTLIQIVQMPDGRILAQVQGAINRPLLNMLISTGHQDLLDAIKKAESGPSIEVARPLPSGEWPT